MTGKVVGRNGYTDNVVYVQWMQDVTVQHVDGVVHLFPLVADDDTVLCPADNLMRGSNA